jgi:hypothetical protein
VEAVAVEEEEAEVEIVNTIIIATKATTGVVKPVIIRVVVKTIAETTTIKTVDNTFFP